MWAAKADQAFVRMRACLSVFVYVRMCIRYIYIYTHIYIYIDIYIYTSTERCAVEGGVLIRREKYTSTMILSEKLTMKVQKAFY